MLAASTVFAQQATDAEGPRRGRVETVRGRVIDATGGALPAATVTVTDAGERTETVATDATGTYVFRSLAPGR